MTIHCTALISTLVLMAGCGPFLRSQDLVTKTYDLRALVAREHPLSMGEMFTPGLLAPEWPIVGRREEPLHALDPSALQELLERAFDPADRSGRQPLLDLQDGILFATASDAAHGQLRQWIELCHHVLLEQVTFELHVLPTSILNGASSVLRREEVDSVLRTSPEHPCYRTTGRIGVTLFVGSLGSDDYVRDYDVEVAQKASSVDPKVDKLRTGALWEIRTTRCVDGRLLIQVDGQAAELPRPPRTVEVQHRDLRGKRQVAAIQLPTLQNASIGALGRLRDGEALLIGGGAEQGSAYCIRLQRSAPAPAQADAPWHWLPVGDLCTTRAVATQISLLPTAVNDDGPRTVRYENDRPTTLTLDQLLTHLRRAHATAELETLPTGDLLVRADAKTRAAILQGVADLAAATQHDLTLEVRSGRLSAADAMLVTTGRVDASELAGRLTTTTLVSTLVDTPFHHLSRTEHSYVRDFEVEIAQESGIPNPVIDTANAGLAISGRVLATGPNRYRLCLDASTSDLLAPIETFDLKDEELSAVELTKVWTIPFDCSPIVEAKRWHLVHVAPLHGGNEHFVMVVRIKN